MNSRRHHSTRRSSRLRASRFRAATSRRRSSAPAPVPELASAVATAGCGSGRGRSRFRSRAIAAARPRCRAVAADGRTGNHARRGAGAAEHSFLARGDRGKDRKSGGGGGGGACARSRSTTAGGGGNVGSNCAARSSRCSRTSFGTDTDNGTGRSRIVSRQRQETMWRHQTPWTVPQGSRLSMPRAMSPVRQTHCASSVQSIRPRTATFWNRCATGRGQWSDEGSRGRSRRRTSIHSTAVLASRAAQRT